MVQSSIETGKEDFIRQAREEPALLKLPIARDILGKDYETITKEIMSTDSPETRLEYGRKLVRLGYSHEQIKSLTIGDAKNILKKAAQIKTLTGMGFSPAEIRQMSEEYIKEVISLLK